MATGGGRIAECRAAKGISAGALARILGVSKTAVWNWERDLTIPRPATLTKLAAALGVEEHYIYENQDVSFTRRREAKAANGHHYDLAKASGGYADAAISLGAPPHESSNGSIAKLLQETRTMIAEMIGVDSGRVKLHVEFWSD